MAGMSSMNYSIIKRPISDDLSRDATMPPQMKINGVADILSQFIMKSMKITLSV